VKKLLPLSDLVLSEDLFLVLVARGSQGGSFPRYLSLAFPVTQVDGLNELPETSEGGQFVVMDHIILDHFCETIIHLPKECSFAPMDVCCKLGELDKIFSSLVVLLHTESFKLRFGFSYWVVGTEVRFEFLDKKSKVG